MAQTEPELVTLAAIEAADQALPPQIVRTPLLASEELSARAGASVWLKAENLQVTGSYKARAAYTVLSRLSAEQRQRGAAISSSGNFAGAWAYMGRLLGIPTAIVMPEKTSPLKVDKTRRYGGEVVLCANHFEARWETLARLETERGLTAINTFESADVIVGHGTLGVEMVRQLPEVDTVLVPMSSGGLLAGIATAVKTLRPSVRIIGVQSEGSSAAYDSFQRGELTAISRVDTICDALVAARPGALPFAHLRRSVDEMALVSDAEVKAAMRWLVEHARLVVEAGGAVGLAALLTGKVRPSGNTIVLLSGGNVVPETLAQYLLETASQRPEP